jgi:hypothetical protein
MATDDVDEEEAVQVTDVTQNNNEEEAVEAHRRPKNPFLLLQFGVHTIPDHF